MNRLKRRSHNRNNDNEIAVAFVAGLLIGALALGLFVKFILRRPAPSRRPSAPAAMTAPLKVIKRAPPAPRSQARIAIILDDFGYNYRSVERLFGLKRPVTLSVLPNLGYSMTIASEAKTKGYEVMLHLPLEPYERDRIIKPEQDMIMRGMRPQQITAILDKDLESVPYAGGVSNHQGSEATEDTVVLRVLFSELKKRGLFFVDSLVTSRSACRKIAAEYGIGFISRDIFLDNQEDFGYVENQMRQLIKIAKKRGYAVGVGHDRPQTVSALAVLMPQAEREGVRFVFASELAR